MTRILYCSFITCYYYRRIHAEKYAGQENTRKTSDSKYSRKASSFAGGGDSPRRLQRGLALLLLGDQGLPFAPDGPLHGPSDPDEREGDDPNQHCGSNPNGRADALVALDEFADTLRERVLLGGNGSAFQEELDVLREVLNRLVAFAAVLLHRLHDDGGELFRDVAMRRTFLRRSDIPVRDVEQYLVDRVALDRTLERQDLVQDRAQRIDVRPMVDQLQLPLRLFRRHVRRRARDLTIDS